MQDHRAFKTFESPSFKVSDKLEYETAPLTFGAPYLSLTIRMDNTLFIYDEYLYTFFSMLADVGGTANAIIIVF